VLAETYGRNGIKKVVRSINPRRKGIILKISLPSSEVSANRPAQAASRSSSIGIWLRAYESASRSVFERKASLPAINAKCLRKERSDEAIHSFSMPWIASLAPAMTKIAKASVSSARVFVRRASCRGLVLRLRLRRAAVFLAG
jgi:hypothetical protein